MSEASEIVLTTLRQIGEVTVAELQADVTRQIRLTGLEWPGRLTPAEVIRQLMREGDILEKAGLLQAKPVVVVQVKDVQRRMF